MMNSNSVSKNFGPVNNGRTYRDDVFNNPHQPRSCEFQVRFLFLRNGINMRNSLKSQYWGNNLRLLRYGLGTVRIIRQARSYNCT